MLDTQLQAQAATLPEAPCINLRTGTDNKPQDTQMQALVAAATAAGPCRPLPQWRHPSCLAQAC
eukprot:scaffold10691_cov19-Tisochrysis_lutea.AAC.1